MLAEDAKLGNVFAVVWVAPSVRSRTFPTPILVASFLFFCPLRMSPRNSLRHYSSPVRLPGVGNLPPANLHTDCHRHQVAMWCCPPPPVNRRFRDRQARQCHSPTSRGTLASGPQPVRSLTGASTRTVLHCLVSMCTLQPLQNSRTCLLILAFFPLQ